MIDILILSIIGIIACIYIAVEMYQDNKTDKAYINYILKRYGRNKVNES